MHPEAAFTALRGFMSCRKDEINAYLDERFGATEPFFYNSVDVRRAGFKIAPVDTNLFPAGFNNLTPEERKEAAGLARVFLDKHHPDASFVVILAENHTRNRYYLENLGALSDIIAAAGREVRITTPAACEAGETLTGESVSGRTVEAEPFIADGGVLKAKRDGAQAGLILINNDMSAGLPDMLRGIDTPVTPPPGYGWYRRRKSLHFDAYSSAARELAAHFDFDPWLISALYRKCPAVDFARQSGIDCIARHADTLLYRIREKYAQYGIAAQPSVFVKADSGTYGMGIMTVQSGEELHSLSRNIRKKMHTVKEGSQNTQVIIQEGVPTADIFHENGNDYAAEPMMYLIGGRVAGRILRYNTKRGAADNLNAPGMGFTPLRGQGEPLCPITDFTARLAAYASSWECYAENYAI